MTRATSRLAIKGRVRLDLFDELGNLKDHRDVTNLVTTSGDEFIAKQLQRAVQPSNPAAPTLPDGMKLGTGSTAAAKSGAGGALVTYVAASNNPFDATFPSAAAVGGDSGWTVTFKTTWAAGDVTNSALREVAMVTDATTDATSSVANTYARAVYASINKTASDSLVVTWDWTVLGA